MSRPLAIDLFCGLGGWTDGLLALGYRVIGYDIEEHAYGDERYRGELVIQDVLTIHGSAFKDAALIVASPPCQFFSYAAMPWSRAKALAAEVRADPERLAKELALFNACFRIQREASEAAGRHIPMVVENVRGAIPWVGRSRGSFGSFHLWGDVPALMPKPAKATGRKAPGVGHGWKHPSDPRHTPGLDFTRLAGRHAMEGVKGSQGYDRDRPAAFGWKNPDTNSKSPARKAASALIAKIPDPLSRHIGMVYWPSDHARTPEARLAA